MVGVFLFLLHLAGFRDHRLEVVRIAVIPRLDGVVSAVADEAKPLCHRRSLGEGLSQRIVDTSEGLAYRNVALQRDQQRIRPLYS